MLTVQRVGKRYDLCVDNHAQDKGKIIMILAGLSDSVFLYCKITIQC